MGGWVEVPILPWKDFFKLHSVTKSNYQHSQISHKEDLVLHRFLATCHRLTSLVRLWDELG